MAATRPPRDEPEVGIALVRRGRNHAAAQSRLAAHDPADSKRCEQHARHGRTGEAYGRAPAGNVLMKGGSAGGPGSHRIAKCNGERGTCAGSESPGHIISTLIVQKSVQLVPCWSLTSVERP